MNKEIIMNTYAIDHGHEGWWELLYYCMKNGNLQYHINAVTDLIQEELKKKIAEEQYPNHQVYQEYKDRKQEILNIEIL